MIASQPILTTNGRWGSWKIKDLGKLRASGRLHFFVEPESWLDSAQRFQVNALLVVSQHLDHFCQANRWSKLSPSGTAPSARDRHTAVWCDVADGMYVFGGVDGSRGLSVNGPGEGRNAPWHPTASLRLPSQWLALLRPPGAERMEFD